MRNRLSAARVRIISPCENRRDLGHVPQLFCHARVDKFSDFAKLAVAHPPSAVTFIVDRRRPRLRCLQFFKLQAPSPAISVFMWHRHSCLCAFQALNIVDRRLSPNQARFWPIGREALACD